MAQLQELILLLDRAAADPSQLASAVKQFQSAVWNSDDRDLGGSEHVRRVLRALANDLDYYVADPIARAEDPTYKGEDYALREIRGALQTLRGAGAA